MRARAEVTMMMLASVGWEGEEEAEEGREMRWGKKADIVNRGDV